MLTGPADPEQYRIQVGRYAERWYTDPLPADDVAPALEEGRNFPSVSTVKGAVGEDWSRVAVKRIAEQLDGPAFSTLAQMPVETRAEVLTGMNRDGLNMASARGVNVHAYAESKLTGTQLLLPNDAPGRNYFAAVDQFFEAYQPELIAAEVVCMNRSLNGGLGYGGTIDAVIKVTIKGCTYLVDWKSRTLTHTAGLLEACQIGGYGRAEYLIVETADGPARVAMPHLDGGLIVSIIPEGFRVYPVDLDAAFAQFSQLHAWFAMSRAESKSIGRFWAPVKKIAAGGVAGLVPLDTSPAAPFDTSGSSGVADATISTAAVVVSAPDNTPPPFDSLIAPEASSRDAHPSARALDWVKAAAPGQLSVAEQYEATPRTPDEGATIALDSVVALRAAHDALPSAVQFWVAAIGATAKRHGVSISITQAQTLRRFEINRGLIHLGAVADMDTPSDADELLRAVLFSVVGDRAWFAGIPSGVIVGSLDHAEAARFALLCDQFASTQVPGLIVNGHLRLEFSQQNGGGA